MIARKLFNYIYFLQREKSIYNSYFSLNKKILLKFVWVNMMSNLENSLVDQVVQNCFNAYQQLPKTGKPLENEWTVLSCIIMYDKSSEEIDVVALGSGSKCVGASKMCSKGGVLNDSHAEIFARRGFLLYLFENIDKSLNNKQSIFIHERGRPKLKEQIEFIFYSSQLPCGDASIIPKTDEGQFGDILLSNKRKLDDFEISDKKLKLEEDIHRTGAKCLPNSEQDPKNPGSNYHIVGQVRTKPGRGDRTLSVSCSDKMAKWIHLGVQGRLLHMLCGPIHIKHFIFGADMPYSTETLTRALLRRNNFDGNLKVTPHFYQTTVPFSSIKTEEKTRPAAGSIVWIKLDCPIFEVAVQGRKLGVTKKKAALSSSSLCISKYNIYKRFVQLLSKYDKLKHTILNEENISTIPYNAMKKKSMDYAMEWAKLKENFFKVWTVKLDMWDFCIS